MRKERETHFHSGRISRGFALWGSCCLLFMGGCQADVGDFFTYAPKSRIITQDIVEETLAEPRGSGTGSQTASGAGSESPAAQSPQDQTSVTQPVEAQTPDTPSSQVQTQPQSPEERIVGNVEYLGIGERGIIRDFPFVYKGLQLSYEGDAERDFSLDGRIPGRPVASTVVREQETIAVENEELLRYGIVSFNKTFYEGDLNYHGDFEADITIAYSGAGKLQPGSGVPVEIPVAPRYSDDDEDWQPATVVISLCDAVGGKSGRTYGVVRNQDGSLDMMQYSYEYTDNTGAKRYVRLIASFYGGASEEQAAGLLNRFTFKYVGENTNNQ